MAVGRDCLRYLPALDKVPIEVERDTGCRIAARDKVPLEVERGMGCMIVRDIVLAGMDSNLAGPVDTQSDLPVADTHSLQDTTGEDLRFLLPALSCISAVVKWAVIVG